MKKLTNFLVASIILILFPIHFIHAQHIDSVSNKAIKKEAPNRIKFSRPEDRGKSLTDEPINQLIDSLNLSANIIQQRKVAKELGDRYILKKLNLTEPQKITISNVVIGYLNKSKSDNSSIREEAKFQIERLWQLASPTLLKYLDSDDLTKAELAAKSLILMRNEEIIKAIIIQANTTSNIDIKNRYIFILSQMQEQRTSLIQTRVCLGIEESTKLYNTLVSPALDKLKK